MNGIQWIGILIMQSNFNFVSTINLMTTMGSSSNHFAKWDIGPAYGLDMDMLDLWFESRKCQCNKRAAIRVVKSDKPTKGKLYYVWDRKSVV